MTGDLPISSGSATICGYDVTTDINSARRFIGYCPQFDALIDCMTPREHLVRTISSLRYNCRRRGATHDNIRIFLMDSKSFIDPLVN